MRQLDQNLFPLILPKPYIDARFVWLDPPLLDILLCYYWLVRNRAVDAVQRGARSATGYNSADTALSRTVCGGVV